MNWSRVLLVALHACAASAANSYLCMPTEDYQYIIIICYHILLWFFFIRVCTYIRYTYSLLSSLLMMFNRLDCTQTSEISNLSGWCCIFSRSTVFAWIKFIYIIYVCVFECQEKWSAYFSQLAKKNNQNSNVVRLKMHSKTKANILYVIIIINNLCFLQHDNNNTYRYISCAYYMNVWIISEAFWVSCKRASSYIFAFCRKCSTFCTDDWFCADGQNGLHFTFYIMSATSPSAPHDYRHRYYTYMYIYYCIM